MTNFNDRIDYSIFFRKKKNFVGISYMKIIVQNLTGTNPIEINFEAAPTVAALRVELSENYHINDIQRTLICQSGQILNDSSLLKEGEIILFSYSSYPQKSYPKVDNAFKFGIPRYGEYFDRNLTANDDPQDINPDILQSALFQNHYPNPQELNELFSLLAHTQNHHSQNRRTQNRHIQNHNNHIFDEQIMNFGGGQLGEPQFAHRPMFLSDFGLFRANGNYDLPLIRDEEAEIEAENERLNSLNVDLTPEDQANINHLMQFSPNRFDVTQIYLACDRNVQSAENILLSMH